MRNNWNRILALRGIGYPAVIATKQCYQTSKFFFVPAFRAMSWITAGPEDELPRGDQNPLGGFRVTFREENDPLRFKEDV